MFRSNVNRKKTTSNNNLKSNKTVTKNNNNSINNKNVIKNNNNRDDINDNNYNNISSNKINNNNKDNMNKDSTVRDCLNWPTTTTTSTSKTKEDKHDRLNFEDDDKHNSNNNNNNNSNNNNNNNLDDDGCGYISTKMENYFLDDDDNDRIIYYNNDDDDDKKKTSTKTNKKTTTKSTTTTTTNRNNSRTKSYKSTTATAAKNANDPLMADLISQRFYREGKQERERLESEKAAKKKQNMTEMTTLMKRKSNLKSNKTSQLRAIAISKSLDTNVGGGGSGGGGGGNRSADWKMDRFKNAKSKLSTINALKNGEKSSDGGGKTTKKKSDLKGHKDEDNESETGNSQPETAGSGYKDELGFSSFVDSNEDNNEIDTIIKEAKTSHVDKNNYDNDVRVDVNHFNFHDNDYDADDYGNGGVYGDGGGGGGGEGFDEYSPPSGHPYTSRGNGYGEDSYLNESSYDVFAKPGISQI